MTPNQQRAYWRLWGQVTRRNRWVTAAGALHPGATLAETDIHKMVWEAAEARAGRRNEPVTVDDLRHGCCVAALGRDKSMTELSSGREATRVFAVMRLLVYPDDIAARQEFEDRNGEQDERRRLVWRIRRAAPLAYILSICRAQFAGQFEGEHWDALPLACLRHLVMTLSQRTKQFREPITSAPAAFATAAAETPF